MIQVLDLSLPQDARLDSAEGPTGSRHRCLFPLDLSLSVTVQLSFSCSTPRGPDLVGLHNAFFMSVGKVGLDDLRGLFQPKRCCGSVKRHAFLGGRSLIQRPCGLSFGSSTGFALVA